MRRAPIPPKRPAGRRAPIIPKAIPAPIPLAVALNYQGFDGRNYGGPKLPCGLCKHFGRATMILKDAKGKSLEPLKNRKCSLHPNAPTGGDIHITNNTIIKCAHFWMIDRFFNCAGNNKRNITAKACAWRYTHKQKPECDGCALGRKMAKWSNWCNYTIADHENQIMKGLEEERI